MGSISLNLPVIGQPSSSEDPKLTTALQTLQTLVNGNLDAANIADGALTATEFSTALADALGLTAGGVTRRGKSIITTEESRTNTSYGLMATPDRVSGIVLPTDGLIAVLFEAEIKSLDMDLGYAAIFLGANQLRTSAGGLQETGINKGVANSYAAIGTSGDGLRAFGWSSAQHTTGQIVSPQHSAAAASSVESAGGPTYIKAAAGTYDISVQYKASSNSVTVKNRRLWVWTLGF